ncbi:MAG: methylenetetrahydrofolate reductase [Desulfatiglans sp.]|jgi:5,10-methylenetetrahydrofolate reductase|nr:methylenetetrahydrofolate reductase [Thermodesulfobacteriota bacterium]MEE4352691.1 methylenetetrahydrofolate reductase [Desulfatiglans sp.]
MSFQKRLSRGEFVVLAEMDTPKGVDISDLINNARRVKSRVDAVVIPDMADGMMRMSALGGAVLMHQQGIEAIIHVYGRDRNRMALQGDILAAHVLGIQNLIVVGGEDMSFGDHRDAKPVDDLDELSILGAIRSLQEGVDLAGFDLKGNPDFAVGCAVAPWADDKALEGELEMARKKIDAGAQFIVTPPVFDLEHFSSFLERAKDLDVPVIATVFLLKSVGIARYMATNEPGVHITEEMINRIRKSPDRETEGIRIAGETISRLKGMTAGVQIITLGWEYQLPSILDHAGL